ncbi:hypothetical protein ABPG75_010288 [Micractinium tetrahymenae]
MLAGQLSLRLAPGADAPRSRTRSACASASSSGAPSGASNGTPAPPPAQPPTGPAATDPSMQQRPAPWSLSNYYTKKLSRQTDSLGNILSSADTIAAAPGWTPDAQLRLAADVLSAELHRDAVELLEQVRQLQALLPGMESSLQRMKPAELVRMATQLEQISQQLLTLRRLLPTADVAAVVAAHPPLLRMGQEELGAALARVREAFPEATQEDLDAMLSANGALLDGWPSLGRCLAGVEHLMTRAQIMRCLQRDPSFLYQFQPLEGQSRGERDAEYLADMFRAS